MDTSLAPDRNSFGVIRLAMAIAVLISHSYLFQSGTRSLEPLVGWTGHSLGEHAVQVFFFLSGILIAQSFDRSRSWREFAVARGLRILPALAVCVLLTAFVLGPVVSTWSRAAYLQDQQLAAYIVKTITLWTGSAPLPGVFDGNPIANIVNMSLWTLKYEVLCYAGLALLGLAGLFNRRYRLPAIALLAFALVSIFLQAPKLAERYTPIENMRYLALYFGMGTLAYMIREHLRLRAAALIPLAVLFAAAIGSRYQELACAVFIGYFTLILAARSYGWLTPYTRANDYSFGVYIYAAPIQQTLLLVFPGVDPVVLSLWALAATLPLAYLSWELIEQPAMALRRQISPRAAIAAEDDEQSASARRHDPAAPIPDVAIVARPSLADQMRRPQVPLPSRQSAIAFRWPGRATEPDAPRTFADGPVYLNRLQAIARSSVKQQTA